MGQFEAMTSYLAAPDAQTKKGADDLFSGSDSPRVASPKLAAQGTEVDGSYMSEVGKYIEGVQIYTADLKRRFEEAKALNEIQLAIIDDLRKDMNAVQQNMQESLESSPPKQATSVPSGKDVESSWESIETVVDDMNESSVMKSLTPKPAMVESGTQTEDFRRIISVRKPIRPVQRGFWTALYEALDGFSDDLHER